MPALPLVWRLGCTALALAFFAGFSPAQQPMPPDQQAEQALTAGQKAYNQGDFGAAAQRFNEVIQKFANTRSASGARFGLAFIQFNSPDVDFPKSIENLTPAANDGAFAERGHAMYHLAVAQRVLGIRELEKPANDANQINQRKQASDGKFTESSKWFNEAKNWFAGQKLDEWSARARADQAEIEIRLGKVKEARATSEPFTKDPVFAKNKHRPLGLYYHGLTCFLEKDFVAAGRVLNQLAPFTDPAFGLHARYLVGRVLHLSNEAAEASVNYDAVLTDFDKAKLAAVEAIKQPDRFKTNPFELARLRTLAQGPTPEYVAGAAFHGACLNYEAGKFPESMVKFQAFAKAFDKDPLAPDSQLRIGFCQVQMRQFDEAAKTLAPLAEKTPRLADQAGFWLGKAQLELAMAVDGAKVDERNKKIKDALDGIRKAIDKTAQLAQQNDADAKVRRPEMLFELADALQANKQSKDAVPVYEQLWNENAVPARREEVLQRLTAAIGAAGDFNKSDERCNEFRKLYPQSTLTPSVVFRIAENAYGRTVELTKDKNKAAELKQKYEDAAGKYLDVMAKYPEFERVNFARLGAGVCFTQLNKLEEAVKALEGIPGPDRGGELSLASYLLADCYIRQAPTKADDALQENQIREKLGAATAMLDTYIGANAKAPETPAALLKLGHCLKRLGSTLVEPNERNATLNKARETFEKLTKEFPTSPLAGQANLERAKVKSLAGDKGGAMNDLRAFINNEPSKNDKFAPLAALHLATMHREQNQSAEAAKVLEEARKRYEADIAKDPERAEWNALLKYHHAVALFEMLKPADARKLFEEVAGQSPGKPIALEAALRSGQCRIAEGRVQITAGQTLMNQAGNDNNKKNAAAQGIAAGRQAINEAADQLNRRAEESKNAQPTAEARARMYYDAAWAWRFLAEEEVRVAREALQKQLQAKKVEELLKKLPPNSPAPNVPLPEVARSAIPRQPHEERTFNSYKRLIDEFPEAELAVEARYEVAELRAERAEHEEVVKILKDALDKEPTDKPVPPDTTERIRLRLGASQYAKKDFAAAAGQFEAVVANPKSPYFAQALYRAGECLFSQGEYAKAIEKLAPFRDKPEFHNIGGISDRAMLRLGLALIVAKNPEAGRQTLETMLGRFGPGNPYASEARFGFAQALQAQGKFDDAIKGFEHVIASTQSDVAAKAQLQIGQCRMAQKKFGDAASAFLVVPYTYDYPELANAAALEAARAFEEDKKPDQAAKLLNKLIKDNPAESEWHKAAKERLGKLKK